MVSYECDIHFGFGGRGYTPKRSHSVQFAPMPDDTVLPTEEDIPLAIVLSPVP